jgi:hypothetical protein
MGLLVSAGLFICVAVLYYFWKRCNIERRAIELLNSESGSELSVHEAHLLAADEFCDSRTSYWMAAIFALISVAIFVLGWQVLTWLRTAVWPELPIRILYFKIGLVVPELSWAGAQKIVN